MGGMEGGRGKGVDKEVVDREEGEGYRGERGWGYCQKGKEEGSGNGRESRRD